MGGTREVGAKRTQSAHRGLVLFGMLVLGGCAVGVDPSSDPSGTSHATGSGTGDGGDPSAGDDETNPSDAGDTVDSNTSSTDAAPTDAGKPETASSPTTTSCTGYALPAESAQCKACTDGGAACQANGCYGGYYCKLATNKCSPKPSGC